METAIYIIVTLIFVLEISNAVDISRINKEVKMLETDSKQFMFLMSKLVDRIGVIVGNERKDGDGK